MGSWVSVTGFLDEEPVLQHTPGGKPVCNFVLRVPKRSDDPGGDSFFVDATVWGDSATYFADDAKEGDAIMIQGKLREDEWFSEFGDLRTKLRIEATSVAATY